MVERKKLNVDISRAISDFEAAVKEFELKEKIYRILYRGKGLEFEGYRDYTPDEDAENIDWKASARANKPLVKSYKEERDLDIIFVVDVSDNMLLGSTQKLKCEYATEMIAALSYLIVTSNDKVGYILFSDNIKEYVPASRGLNQLYVFADKLADPETYGGSSDMNKAFKFALNFLPNSTSAVIFVSDFVRMNESIKKDLYLLASKFEITAIMVRDFLDRTLPEIDREVVIEDPVTKKQIIFNPKAAKNIYEKYIIQKDRIIKDIFKKSNVDLLELYTDEYFVFPLATFLKGRVEKKRLVV